MAVEGRYINTSIQYNTIIKEDLQNVLLLLARKPWGTGIMIHWSIAAVSTLGSSHFGLHWSWSKNHRRLLSRCPAGTTSSTCYLKHRLLDVWAEWSSPLLLIIISMRMTPNYSYLFLGLFSTCIAQLLSVGLLTKSLNGCHPTSFVSTLPKQDKLICPNQENSWPFNTPLG